MAAKACQPLPIHKLRDLELAGGPGQASSFLYAASGLVATGGELYVVADDELHLARFALRDATPGTLLRLLPGELPEEAVARKAGKADFEILLQLPPLMEYPNGALLALGSGSRPTRHRGAMLALDERGRAAGDVVALDASPLFARLAGDVGTLNLEGGWVQHGRMRLLQRGNQGGSANAIIDLDFAALAQSLARERVLRDLAPARVTPMDLGTARGVRLGFTDACGLPDGNWIYSAVAEDTADAYEDGGFAGAVVGLATAEARILWQRPLLPAMKVEGLYGERVDGGLRILCVTDADNRRTPAQLLEARLGSDVAWPTPMDPA